MTCPEESHVQAETVKSRWDLLGRWLTGQAAVVRSPGLQDYELPDGRSTPSGSRLVVVSNEGARFVPEDFVGISNPEEYIDDELERIFNAPN